MKEYIEREALIDNLNRFAPEHYNALINMLIEKQPAADVVEVVRCKDCKHWTEAYKNCKYGDCKVYDDYGNYPADWYCADGERRNDVEQG